MVMRKENNNISTATNWLILEANLIIEIEISYLSCKREGLDWNAFEI
jgi:hypothetical protein